MLMTSRLKKYKPPVNTLYEKNISFRYLPVFYLLWWVFFLKECLIFFSMLGAPSFLLFIILSFSNIAKIHRNRKSEN